jgi:hypothetical protein
MSIVLSTLNREKEVQETASEAPPIAPNDFEVHPDLEAVSDRPGARQGTGGKS